MAVWDCFPFFNELDLLEIRLHELKDVVDRFVLVESYFTHSGLLKPLYYEQNRGRFVGFPIEHVVIQHPPKAVDPEVARAHPDHPLEWTRENHQRNAITRGLIAAEPDDMVMVSDADEIPRASAVTEALACLRNGEPSVVFWQETYYYSVNLWAENEGCLLGTRAVLKKNLGQPQSMRSQGGQVIIAAGWHFGWMGDCQKKLEAFAHQELNKDALKDPVYIEECKRIGRRLHDQRPLKWVPIDDTHPLYLRQNLERFAHLTSQPVPG